MFQEDDKNFLGIKINAKVIVAISFMWSLYSFTTSHVRGLTGHREYFPISSKSLLLTSVLCATLNRVITTTIFFTPPLGLFDILRHYQGIIFILLHHFLLKVYYSTVYIQPNLTLTFFFSFFQLK